MKLKDSLARSLNCADRIKLLGSVSKRKGDALRRQADIFPDHNQTGPVTGQTEAFGVSIIEAMSEGLPVVTGKFGGITDMIEHEKNGILFEPGYTTAHARALLELSHLQEKREHLGRAAWEKARQQFSVELETSGLYSIIRGVHPDRENQLRSSTVNSLDKS